MAKWRWVAAASFVFAAAGCEPRRVECGPGTRLSDDVCVVDVRDAGNDSTDGGPIPIDASMADASTDASEVALPPGIFPLEGFDPALSNDDLAPLDALIAGAEVVAAGESIHTSGGYYNMKDRLFRYLVAEHGYRAFAIESPWRDADRLREHVNEGCPGSTRQVLSTSLFGVWVSEELLSLVEWACSWNAANPTDRLVFFGFDIQQPWADGGFLRDYFARVDPSAPHPAAIAACNGVMSASSIDYYRGWPESGYVEEEQHAQCIAALDALDADLSARRERLVEDDPPALHELELAELAAVGLRAWQEQMYYYYEGGAWRDAARSLEARDRGMAHTFRVLRTRFTANAKTFLWAHNTHIATAQHLIDGYYIGGQSMGTFLAQVMGEEYVALGLFGWDVTIEWGDVGRGPIGTPPPHHGEARLHELGRPALLVDLDFPGAEAPFFARGASVNLQRESMVPRDQFRALVFLDHSPGMTLL